MEDRGCAGSVKKESLFRCKESLLFNWLCWQPVRTGKEERKDEENGVGERVAGVIPCCHRLFPGWSDCSLSAGMLLGWPVRKSFHSWLPWSQLA